MRAGSSDAGVDEGVEDDALGLTQPGHDRHRQRCEQLAGATDRGAPGDGATEAALRLARDADPLGPGLLTEPRDAALLAGAVADAFGVGERAGGDDLVAVDSDRDVGVPPFGQPATDPALDVFCGASLGWHAYMITTLQITVQSRSPRANTVVAMLPE